MIAFPHASNVIAHINPVREIADIAHSVGAIALVDVRRTDCLMSPNWGPIFTCFRCTKPGDHTWEQWLYGVS